MLGGAEDIRNPRMPGPLDNRSPSHLAGWPWAPRERPYIGPQSPQRAAPPDIEFPLYPRIGICGPVRILPSGPGRGVGRWGLCAAFARQALNDLRLSLG